MLSSKPIAGFICCLLFTCNVYAEEKLVFALDVIRHGDRSPAHDYPGSKDQWPEGLGQLTPLGMNQEYQLGVSLRTMYVTQYHLLAEHFIPNTVYVRSSDYDRTLESAQALLMGLYPPGTGPMLEDQQPALPQAVQLVPVNTVPQESDSLLIPYNDSAQYYALLQQYVFDTPGWKEKTAELAPKFPAWSAATGMTITNLYQLSAVADTLFVERTHNITLPPDLSAEDVQTIIDAGQWAMVYAYKDKNVSEAIGRNLLNAIAKYIAAAGVDKAESKYVLFSAHDNTLMSEMKLLNVPLDEVPHYASNLNFSVFTVKPDTYVVRIHYNGQPVILPDCANVDCPLSTFLTLVKG
jgi:lysosomal acid phosphatase